MKCVIYQFLVSFGNVARSSWIKVQSRVQTVKLIQRMNISDLFPSIRWLDIQGIEAELRDVEIQLRKSITVLIEQKKLEMSTWSSSEIESGANERDIMSKLLSLEGEDRLNDDQQMGVVFVCFLHLLYVVSC